MCESLSEGALFTKAKDQPVNDGNGVGTEHEAENWDWKCYVLAVACTLRITFPSLESEDRPFAVLA